MNISRLSRYVPRPARWSGLAGFTMIEIALCLAIIGFALVAIIGVLPVGLNVQRDNREETIINQDAVVWMNAIRNGAQGFDDLTNYVMVISNISTRYIPSGTNWVLDPETPNPNLIMYTQTNFIIDNLDIEPPYLITNGMRIVGLLSKPRIHWTPTGFNSNFIIAHVRALSGSATEKAPQNDANVLEGAFAYRLIPELHSYLPVDPDSTNYLAYTNAAAWVSRSNHWRKVTLLNTNSTDIRLNFRWPLLPAGVGNGRQTFRVFTGGCLMQTNEISKQGQLQTLYFLQPSVYIQARMP